jgi:hypothetical protein
MKKLVLILIATALLIVVARCGLSTWDLRDCNFGTRAHPVLIISMNVDYVVLSTTDLGVCHLALVQGRKDIGKPTEKIGVPMWFVQMPFCKWLPV